jgi:hypothetical protein
MTLAERLAEIEQRLRNSREFTYFTTNRTTLEMLRAVIADVCKEGK